MRAYFKSAIHPLIASLVLSLAACGGDSVTLPGEGDPSAIQPVLGAAQEATVGEVLPESLAVRVTDTEGRPIVGQRVTFVPANSAGTVAPAEGMTDSTGRVATSWRLGTTAGLQAMEARVAGNLKAVFSATAHAAEPDSLSLVSGDHQVGQIGQELDDSLVVRVRDAFGNPVPGVVVNWVERNGTLSAGTAATDSSGRAAVTWTLGIFPGAQQVTASFGAVEVSPVIFSAVATFFPAGDGR
jgi:hypothetical protein